MTISVSARFALTLAILVLWSPAAWAQSPVQSGQPPVQTCQLGTLRLESGESIYCSPGGFVPGPDKLQ